ncbi:MAG: hypothetical protein JXA22_08010 [Candidatus Thermoplasmatota archaeon]|nr:hypothetical protein [Candidatus Thermoplasmatota archaeon]
MFGVEPYWILSEALLLITFILLIVTYILLPGKEDVQAGVGRIPGWIPALHAIMFIMALAIIIISVLLVEKNLIIIITGIILLIALVLAFIDYIRVRNMVGNYSAVEGVQYATVTMEEPSIHIPPHQVPNVTPHHDPHQRPTGQGTGSRMMTVECPQCQGHIELPEGSHHITCPYCGLSGSL